MLAKLVDEGWDLTALMPSCVLMFKQELPLMFPDDPDVQKVKNAFFDPFEYLMLRHKEGKLKTDFKQPLGKVAYHAACHQRVQNIGPKTKECLSLVPNTEVDIIERCSGHDGTYAVKKEFHEFAMKIVKPVVKRVNESRARPLRFSDCAMAGHHIAHARADGTCARASHHPAAEKPTESEPCSPTTNLFSLEQYARHASRVPRQGHRAQEEPPACRSGRTRRSTSRTR